MAKATITYLADDLDGSDADETIRFALDGKSYEIDLNKKNAAALRKALRPYVVAGRSAGRSGGRRTSTRRRAGARGSKTAFSKLTVEDRGRFRKWAKLPNARRIADEQVKAWIEAGRP
jgi:nucleoid-associated protein Lsr2